MAEEVRNEGTEAAASTPTPKNQGGRQGGSGFRSTGATSGVPTSVQPGGKPAGSASPSPSVPGAPAPSGEAGRVVNVGGQPNVFRHRTVSENTETAEERDALIKKQLEEEKKQYDKIFKEDLGRSVNPTSDTFTELTNAGKGLVAAEAFELHEDDGFLTGTYDELMGITRGGDGSIEPQDVEDPNDSSKTIKVKYKNPNHLDLLDLKSRSLEDAIFTKELRESYTKCMIVTVVNLAGVAGNALLRNLRPSASIVLPVSFVARILQEGAELMAHIKKNDKFTLEPIVYSHVVKPEGVVVTLKTEKEKLEEARKERFEKEKVEDLALIEKLIADFKKEYAPDKLPEEADKKRELLYDLSRRLEAIKMELHNYAHKFGETDDFETKGIDVFNAMADEFFKKLETV